MKVVGFDGREYSFPRKTKADLKKSKYHLEAVELVKEMFPGQTIIEEPELPGTKKAGLLRNLYADIFLPSLNILIEVHGDQHYEYNPFFHGTRMDFIKQKKKDGHKKSWCELNSIVYVELPYNDRENWRRRILDSLEA